MMQLNRLIPAAIATAAFVGLTPNFAEAAIFSRSYTTNTLSETVNAGSTPEGISLKYDVVIQNRSWTLATGASVSGLLLNLTNVEIINNSSNRVTLGSSTNPFLEVSNTFTSFFTNGSLTQAFTGTFSQFLPGSNSVVDSGATSSYILSFPNATRTVQQSYGLTAPTVGIGAGATASFDEFRPSTSVSVATSPTVTARIDTVSLGAGERLFLPGSACSLLLDSCAYSEQFLQQQITLDQLEIFCNEGKDVPEPSAAIALLGLGAVGMLYRNRRPRSA